VRRTSHVLLGAAALFLLGGIAVPARAGCGATTTPVPTADRVSLRSQLGIIYAQNGQHDQARAEFVKLLEEPQGRAAGLVNLGNLSFLDSDVQTALESYLQAEALDGKDAGIVLNQGLAFKQLGRTEDADKAFARAVEMAGGVEKASYLLGLTTAEDTGRGKVSKMTADEVRQMLVKAKTTVPAASTTAKPAASTSKVTSRPGGARAAEVAVGEQNLYWKER
jgi:tetratricopeptide (TPR) repeat protein